MHPTKVLQRNDLRGLELDESALRVRKFSTKRQGGGAESTSDLVSGALSPCASLDVLQPDGFQRDASQPHVLQGAICPACLLTLSRRLDETTQVQIAVNYATPGVSQCFSLCFGRTLPLCLPEPQDGFNKASFPATSTPSFQTSSLGLQ